MNHKLNFTAAMVGLLSCSLFSFNPSFAQTVEIKNNYEWGKLENGIKVGVWQYFDNSSTLTLSVNHSNGRILYALPTEGECDVLLDQQWERLSVDRKPIYLGSMYKFYESIGYTLRYPQAARAGRIEGIVEVGMVIDTMGKMVDYQVLQEMGGGVEDEVIRCLKNINPYFIPAVHQGRRVVSRLSIPLIFCLGKSDCQLQKVDGDFSTVIVTAGGIYEDTKKAEDVIASVVLTTVKSGYQEMPYTEIFKFDRKLRYVSNYNVGNDSLLFSDKFEMSYQSIPNQEGGIVQQISFEADDKQLVAAHMNSIRGERIEWKKKLIQVVYGGKDYIYFPAYIVNQYTITASAPPLYIDTERLTEGNFWEFEVNVNEVGSLLNGHLNCYYRVLEQKEISMPWGMVNDCWLIRAEADHITLGKSHVDFIFHEQWGMLRADYRFFNGDQLNIVLKSFSSKNVGLSHNSN